jgi:hypothetical protein
MYQGISNYARGLGCYGNQIDSSEPCGIRQTPVSHLPRSTRRRQILVYREGASSLCHHPRFRFCPISCQLPPARIKLVGQARQGLGRSIPFVERNTGPRDRHLTNVVRWLMDKLNCLINQRFFLSHHSEHKSCFATGNTPAFCFINVD